MNTVFLDDVAWNAAKLPANETCLIGSEAMWFASIGARESIAELRVNSEQFETLAFMIAHVKAQTMVNRENPAGIVSDWYC